MSDPNAPEVAQQFFANDYYVRHGVIDPIPTQLLVLPFAGRIEAQHARSINVSIIEPEPGAPALVMVMAYNHASGDRDGLGLFSAMPAKHARAVAAAIVRACDMVDAGIDIDTRRCRPPEQPQ